MRLIDADELRRLCWLSEGGVLVVSRAEIDAAPTICAQAEAEKNEPLTLDELREMAGQPVYLVSTVHEQDTGWVIIKSSVVDSHGCRYLVTSDGFYVEDCFIRGDVKAYRRKPEEE